MDTQQPLDTVRIVDSLGVTAYWFYTSCKAVQAPDNGGATTHRLADRLANSLFC